MDASDWSGRFHHPGAIKNLTIVTRGVQLVTELVMSGATEKNSHASASNPANIPTNEYARPLTGVAKFIEDWLVVPKILYFGLNVVIYSTHAFLFQYVQGAWGLKKDEYNLTNFVQFTNIAGSFVFSRLADRTGKYRLIVAGCVAAYTATMCLLLYCPFDINPEAPSNKYKIAYYLLINAIAFFFTAGTFPLLDSMVMSKLSSNPKLSKEMFGRQRLWGTIGHCVIGVIVKGIYNVAGRDYKVMFYTLIVSSIGFIAAVFLGIPGDLKIEAHSHGHHGHHSGNKDSKEATAAATSGPRPNAMTLLLSPSFSFFLGTVLVAGLVRAVITTNQSPFITEELKYDISVVSSSIFVRVFPETALYFFSKEITQWVGIYWVLIIGHTAGVLRMFGYTMVSPSDGNRDDKGNLPEPKALSYVFILLLECLKGVNSSLVISSAARIASDMAPKGLASTAQGLVAGVWQGLSMTLGSLAGFYLIGMIHINGTFTIFSLAGGICIVLIILKFALIDRVIFTTSRKSVA